VSWLVRDTVDGSLSPGGSFADRDSGVYGLSRLSGVAIDAEGRFVYTVAGDYSDGAVTWWHRDPQTGNLSFAGIARNRYKGVTQMREPRHITLTRDGAHAYVAAIGENNGGSYDAITAFSRDAATGELAFLDDYKDPDYGVPAIERASDIVIAPEGRDVYVASPSEYSVCWFRRDPIGGGLTYENHFDQPYHPDVDFVNWTYGARSMALNADGTRLYVAGDTTFTGGWHTWNMWTYERNPATGWLGRMQEISGFHESVPEFWNALWTAVSPDGAHVYVGAATLDDDPTGGILLFRVSYDGLWYVSTYRDSSFAMRGFCMAPDGAHIYAVPWNGPLIAYSRDSTSGYLSRLGPATGDPLPGYPTAAACSPDGRDVYVGLVDGIAHLTRDSSSGMLGLVGTVRNGTGGADGIVSPNQVVVSPDGLAVYALTDTALVWLTRDTTTGALEFDGVSYGSPDGTAGLRGGWRAALSPDQQHVYLVARREDAVVFYRVERGLVPVSHAPSAGGAEATARVRLRLGGRVFEVDAVSGVPGTSLRVQVLNSAGRVVACEYVDGIGERDAPCVLFPVLGAGAYVCRVSAGTRAMATRLVVVP